MIYQLAKTSPFLSGQVRWDFCIHHNSTGSFADELHIVPLSNNVKYDEDNARKTLNYSHADNVKHLYNEIESEFYSCIGDHKHHGNLIYNQGVIIDPFDHTYEMGARRIRYSRYDRQFAFLCPMWISEKIDYSKLHFLFTISDANPSLSLNTIGNNVQAIVKFSDDIIAYIDEYMNKCGNSAVNDDLLSLNFDPNDAHITGLQVNNGKMSTIDVTNILYNIMTIERPMMDFDDMLVKLFSQNHIVSRQLINFNFIFNIEDVFSQAATYSIIGHDINIKCNVMYDGQEIAIKDIYTNYTNIPVYDIDNHDFSNTNNVLDYKQDYSVKNMSLINKDVQPIFHWSLLENPDMIYNLYDGFGSCITNQYGEVHRIHGSYYNQANISNPNYSVQENTLEWCKHYDLGIVDQSVEVLTNTEFTNVYIKEGIVWFSNNKFEIVEPASLNSTLDIRPNVNLYINTIKYVSDNQIPDSVEFAYGDDKIYIVKIDSEYTDDFSELTYKMSIMSDKLDNLTMRSVVKFIKYYLSTNSTTSLAPDMELVLKNLCLLYDGWIPPFNIQLYKSAEPIRAINNDYNDKVNDYTRHAIEYVQDDKFVYLYRYFGNLIPTFIDVDDRYRYNLSFYYKQWSNINDPLLMDYMELLKLGFLPEYPRPDSINPVLIDDNSFYTFKSCRFTSTHSNWYDINWPGEITWMNDNKLWVLKDKYDMSIIKQANIDSNEVIYSCYEMLLDRLTQDLSWMYSVDRDWLREWVKSCYKLTINSYDYVSLTDISRIKYKITFNLL